MRVLILSLVVLAGCQPAQRATPVLSRAPAQTVVMAQPVSGGEVLVLDIANKTPIGSDAVQRCYVWRDAAFKTATMHCGTESTWLGLEPAGD